MIHKSIYKSSYTYVVAFFYFLLACTVDTKAQVRPTFIDSLFKQVERYGINNHVPEMFVHFDKTIYSNNENVWLTAYLLDTTNVNKNTTLIVNLIKDDTRTVALEDKFVMSNGLAFGNLFIPDSTAAGNYTFVAYTNLMLNGNPYIIFKQPVTIKTANQATFTAQLSPVDTAITSTEMKVRLMANVSAVEVLPNAEVSYYIGSPANHLLAGKVKTDASGQYVFNVPSKILSPGNNKIYVRVKHKGEEKEVIMSLPVARQLPVVNFYPEGGNLVNNLQSVIGWEVKTADNIPLQVNAVLYKDDRAVDTIETNGYGMGKFLLVPKSGSKYVVKLNATGKSYDLPVILTSGSGITIQQGLANDTLNVILQHTKAEKLLLLVHNYRELFSATPIVMNSAFKRVKVLLNEVPKGINQITVIDSLGRPFAQRAFFAHYNRRQSLQINAGADFGTRQKVNVKIKLNNKDTAAMALVSISAVQENRVEVKKKNDIESYFYLNSQLGDLPIKENYLGNDEADREFLENVLLIKGWARYKWADVLKTDNDPANIFDIPVFNGAVTNLAGKPLKKPVTVMMVKQEGITPIQTDSTGNFMVDHSDMITMQNKKVTLMPSGESADSRYRLKFIDPYINIINRIPAQLSYKDHNTVAQQSTANMEIAGNEKTIQLKEVTIKDKNDDLFHGSFGLYGTNACGDYVCRYNNLNCPNHRSESDNKIPVQGGLYNVNGIRMPYGGCTISPKNNLAISIKGIYTSLEFYPSDYAEISPSQPEYISTVYWKHLEKVTAGKETNFSFYTSDITGRFKIIIQGITDNDVVYGEKTFNVTKPK